MKLANTLNEKLAISLIETKQGLLDYYQNYAEIIRAGRPQSVMADIQSSIIDKDKEELFQQVASYDEVLVSFKAFAFLQSIPNFFL